jgi:hypothetical protein
MPPAVLAFTEEPYPWAARLRTAIATFNLAALKSRSRRRNLQLISVVAASSTYKPVFSDLGLRLATGFNAGLCIGVEVVESAFAVRFP